MTKVNTLFGSFDDEALKKLKGYVDEAVHHMHKNDSNKRPPSVKNVGKWEITDSMFVYRPTKPNAVVRFFAKLLLGFKWHDEIQS